MSFQVGILGPPGSANPVTGASVGIAPGTGAGQASHVVGLPGPVTGASVGISPGSGATSASLQVGLTGQVAGASITFPGANVPGTKKGDDAAGKAAQQKAAGTSKSDGD